MKTPVGSIALEIPFQEASMLYFCLAVRGSLGSGGAGAGGPSLTSGAPRCVAASLPSSQPILDDYWSLLKARIVSYLSTIFTQTLITKLGGKIFV